MKNVSTLLVTGIFVLFSLQLSGQMYDFKDAIIPVVWEGDRSDFQVSNVNQLQLNAPLGKTSSSLSWPCIQAENYSWEFYFKYEFAASTTNYATIYLLSTNADFNSANNISYYLKIGGATGSTDKIELIYQQGLTKQVVLESRTGIVGASQVACRIHVLKSALGEWELKIDITGGFNYIKEASAHHWQTNAFKYSGIRCLYSSTRRDKFYFDDIKMYEPFAIQGYTFDNDSTLKIHFNQVLATGLHSSNTIDFNTPYSIIYGSDYMLFNFTERIRPGTYIGTITNIFSSNGDSLSITSIQIIKELIHYIGQIRISEWMSNPSPTYGLPEVEWIELVNMSEQPINLNKISIADPSTKVKLSAYSLSPDSAVIVCSLNACKYFFNQKCIEVNSMPSLNNSSDSIFIFANDTLLIDYIYYNASTLPSDFRSDGGYSMIREEYPGECLFSNKINFTQNHMGGTPGIISSLRINNAITIHAAVLSAKEVNIQLNGQIFFYKTSINVPIGIAQIVTNANTHGTSYTYHLQGDLEAGNVYDFRVDSIRTCRNQIKSIDKEIEIIYPKQIEKNEVFINEVLYNPSSGGVDFIELYNYSSKYIQLQNSHFYNKMNTTVQHSFLLGTMTIAPFGFITLTSDTSILKQQYSNTVSANAFQLMHFLSLADTGGELIWLNQNADTIDQVSYGDNYQNPLHRNTEGYSLEKITSAEPSFYAANWTTSAVQATPGYLNSQHNQADSSRHKPFYCSPCHVTTNLNGINDYVLLFMSEATQGCFGSISIYTLAGEKVIDLIVNQPLGNFNTFQWNGQEQGGALLEEGIYVAIGEWWSSDGKTYVSKIAISTSQY